uniref:Nodulin-like domain-containing protein n=1 Tax=Triticum urartu TaxID=4572 RepID=A0A8R7V9G5_TRIUA
MWLAGPDPARLPRALDMLLAAQAWTFLYTADVVTAVENFPGHRGIVNGILKGFLGVEWSNTGSGATHPPY